MPTTRSSVAAPGSAVLAHTDTSDVEDLANYSLYEEGRVCGCQHCVSKPNAGDTSAVTMKICCYKTLDLPSMPLPPSNEGWAPLKQVASAWLQRVVTAHPECQSKEEQALCWQNTELELCEVWGNRDGLLERKNSDVSNKEVKVQRSPNRIERLQVDWCETNKPTEGFLLGDSKRMLRKMVTANVQVAFLAKYIDVEDAFAGDWGRPYLDERLPSGKEGLRLLLLPFDVVRDDDAKMTRLPGKIVCLARRYLRALQRPRISLTSAFMNVPCIWNSHVAVDCLARMTTEKLVMEEKLLNSLKLTSSLQLSRKRAKVRAGEGVRHQSDLQNGENRSANTLEYLPSTTKVEEQVSTSTGVKLDSAATKEDRPLNTDYFLSNNFLRCNWSEPTRALMREIVRTSDKAELISSEDLFMYDDILHQIARPALWDLVRKKLLLLDGAGFRNALGRVNLETLEAIVFQQFQIVKMMSLNPSTARASEIIEACFSLRQAAWLHTLRLVTVSEDVTASETNVASAIVAKILSSIKYKLLLGASNWKDLHRLLKITRTCVQPSRRTVDVSEEESDANGNLATSPPLKKQRVLQSEKDPTPVRVMCSVQFLKNDELLDDLCTEQRVFFIERDLPPPVDILVDERSCICVVDGGIFQVEPNMRNFIFSLARLQVQFQKCWIVIVLDAGSVVEDTMDLFFAALVQFRVEIQVLTSFSREETSHYVRAIVDECADVALSCQRILPRMWFERPFLLEEESQFERFLVSTKTISSYSAQSLLHRISMKDLFTKSIDELKPLVRNAITDEQAHLLWGLMHQNHGLNIAIE